MTLNKLFNDYFKLLRARVGIDLTDGVYRKYELVRKQFMAHCGDLPLCQVGNKDILSFQASLNRYKSTTAAGMLTKLKTVFLYAFNNGLIQQNPFSMVKISKKQAEIKLFSEEELNRILHKQFVSERVNKVRDLFCFAAGSGLAYCDCMLLSPSDFQKIDGHTIIKKERKKTGITFCSILTPWAVEIAEKYNYDFTTLKISNQKVNQTLKDIQDSCGVKVNLTFHLARHWYCTYRIASGVPITTVQRLVGHSQISMTQRYTHLDIKSLIDSVDKQKVV